MSKKQKNKKKKLHTYDVTLSGIATVATVVTVEASDEKAAKKYALLLAKNNEPLEWEWDDDLDTIDNVSVEEVEEIADKPILDEEIQGVTREITGFDDTPPYVSEYGRGGYKGRG